MTREEILKSDNRFKYQLLSRMKSDCDYWLGIGGRCDNHLWGLNKEDHISFMYDLWKSFHKNDKPEWLVLSQINEYRERMSDERKLTISNKLEKLYKKGETFLTCRVGNNIILIRKIKEIHFIAHLLDKYTRQIFATEWIYTDDGLITNEKLEWCVGSLNSKFASYCTDCDLGN